MTITTNNYFTEAAKLNFSAMPEALRKSHDFVVRTTSNGNSWAMYHESDTIKKTIDAYFSVLSKHINGNTKKPAGTKSPKAPKPPKQSKPPKAPKAQKEPQSIKKTRHISEDVKFIKRYVGLNSRVKSPNAILNFIKGLQKAIVQGFITKKSEFAKEINYIQEKLIKLYDKMEGETKVDINDDDLNKLVKIAGGEEVYPSIGIIKRFVGLQGKTIDQKKKEDFIKNIENAFKKGKLKEDPFAERVNSILQALKQYKAQRPVNIASAELNGLKKIAKKCSCSHSTAGKTDSYNYQITMKGRSLNGVMTAQEIANRTFDMLPFYGEWQRLIGTPAKNFTMMVHGEPGGGKTTFLMKFTKFLSSIGSVLYVSSEEFDSVTLTEKVQTYLSPMPYNVHFASSLRNVNPQKYGVVIIDSVNDLGINLEQFKELKRKCPETAFILVLQHTKDGQFRGGKEWEHEVQIAGKVTSGVIDIYKNRYGVKGSMNFFNSNVYQYD